MCVCTSTAGKVRPAVLRCLPSWGYLIPPWLSKQSGYLSPSHFLCLTYLLALSVALFTFHKSIHHQSEHLHLCPPTARCHYILDCCALWQQSPDCLPGVIITPCSLQSPRRDMIISATRYEDQTLIKSKHVSGIHPKQFLDEVMVDFSRENKMMGCWCIMNEPVSCLLLDAHT